MFHDKTKTDRTHYQSNDPKVKLNKRSGDEHLMFIFDLVQKQDFYIYI